MSDSEPKKDVVTLRCLVTGNPCGTDTWNADYECPCDSCQQWLDHEQAGIICALDSLSTAINKTEEGVAVETCGACGSEMWPKGAQVCHSCGPAPAPSPDERAEFEKLASEVGFPLALSCIDEPGSYINENTQGAWTLWRVASAFRNASLERAESAESRVQELKKQWASERLRAVCAEARVEELAGMAKTSIIALVRSHLEGKE